MPTSFYQKRRLPEPDRELRPETGDALCEILDELEAGDGSWRLLGDGQHVRPSREGGAETVVRTGALDGVLEFDDRSGTIRVGAGMRWKELSAVLDDRDRSLQRYGLHPPTATVGGMLARRRTGPEYLRGGALLDGCVSVGTHRPGDGDYRYLVAPRKASGPDLRYVAIGAGGDGGAILDATLVVWPPIAARLVRYEDCSPARAARIAGAVFDGPVTPTWMHYGSSSEVFQFGVAAPGQLLRARIRHLTDRLGEPDVVGDTEECRRRKEWLQARHPDRRSHPDADATRVFEIVPGAVTEDLDEVFGPGVVDVEMTAWTPRRVRAFVRYEDEEYLEEAADAPPAGTCWATWRVAPTV